MPQSDSQSESQKCSSLGPLYSLPKNTFLWWESNVINLWWIIVGSGGWWRVKIETWWDGDGGEWERPNTELWMYEDPSSLVELSLRIHGFMSNVSFVTTAMTIFAGHITPTESFTILYSPFQFAMMVTMASNIVPASGIWISTTTFPIITTPPKFGSQCHLSCFRLYGHMGPISLLYIKSKSSDPLWHRFQK